MRLIKQLVAKIKKGKDASALASNFGYMMLLQVAGYVFPLMTIPYLARVIGVEGVGKIAFAAAIVMWFQTISDWGFNYSATRDIARNKENTEEVSNIFSRVIWSKIYLMIFSLLLLLLLMMIVPYFKSHYLIILVTFLIVPGNVFYPEWFFQGIEKMKYITVFQLISKVFFTVLIFIFVNDEADYFLPPLFLGLGYIVTGFFAMYIILFKWRVKVTRPSFKEVFQTIKSSSNIFLNNIAPNLYTTFSSVLLGVFGGGNTQSNGLLDAGYKFAGVAQQFMLVVARVFFPFLSRKIDAHKAYAMSSIFVASLFSLILYSFSEIIILFFYTAEFEPAISVLKILSITVLFTTLINVYGTNYLIARGQDRALRNITLICSFVGFSIAIPLVYYYSYIGAALTIAISRGMLGVSVTYVAIYYMRSIKSMKKLV